MDLKDYFGETSTAVQEKQERSIRRQIDIQGSIGQTRSFDSMILIRKNKFSSGDMMPALGQKLRDRNRVKI